MMEPRIGSLLRCRGPRLGYSTGVLGRTSLWRESTRLHHGFRVPQPRPTGVCLPEIRCHQSIQRHRRQKQPVRLTPCHAASSSVPLPPPQGIQTLLASLQKQISSLSRLWKTFLPMCTLFFFMALVNTIVSSLALTLVVTAPGGGAQVLPFLTVYAALPASLLFMVVYAYASHHFDRRRVFTLVISAFAAFNLFFILFLYPNHGAIHLHDASASLSKVLPAGLDGAVGLVRNWTFSLFYCVSELWGDVGLSLLFWGFANEVTSLEDAPIVYPLFGIGANIAQMLGGLVLRSISSVSTEFAASLQTMIFLVIGCKVVVLFLHNLITSEHLRKQAELDHGQREINLCTGAAPHAQDWPQMRRTRHNENNGKKCPNPIERNGETAKAAHLAGRPPPKTNNPETSKSPSLMEALKTLSKSPEIRALGIITLSQSLAVNLMEFVWKSHLRIAYPTPAAFTSFMGDVSTATGFITGCMIVASPILFDQLSWGGVAGITPKIMLSGGIAFFGAALGYQILCNMGIIGASQGLLSITVLGGAALYIVARGVRFSLFKPAEEMVYIRLDKESQTKGKAAIDVVGAQTGKSGGSLLQQGLLLMSGGALLYITPVMFAAYLAMVIAWHRAVDDLAVHQDKAVGAAAEQNSSNLANLKMTSAIHFPELDEIDDDRNGPSTLAVSALAG